MRWKRRWSGAGFPPVPGINTEAAVAAGAAVAGRVGTIVGVAGIGVNVAEGRRGTGVFVGLLQGGCLQEAKAI